MTKCRVCDAEFSTARPKYEKYCSDECRHQRRLDEGRIYREANRERLREWFRRNHAQNRERYKEKSRRRRAAQPKKPPTERVCRMCGTMFFERRHRAYCSTRCQRDHHNEHRKRGRTRRAIIVYAPRLCAVCGDAFVGPPRQKVCSLVECQTARKRVETAIWVANNHEHFLEWARRYRAANPERIKENAHNCYMANRAWVNEKSRLSRIANPARARERARDYYGRASAAVLWWREHIGPAGRADGPKILAALREVGYDDRG